MEKKLPLKEKHFCESLREVKDLEFSFSIVERNLVDEIGVKGEEARMLFHLTMLV